LLRELQLEYRVVMVSDANETWTDEEHTATLNSFMLFFGDVMTADDTIARLAKSPAVHTARV
jgi:ureidoacrylate peracid hydrolase